MMAFQIAKDLWLKKFRYQLLTALPINISLLLLVSFRNEKDRRGKNFNTNCCTENAYLVLSYFQVALLWCLLFRNATLFFRGPISSARDYRCLVLILEMVA